MAQGLIFMHLYVHIPFCHRICPYCAFHKHTPGATDMKRFIESLLIELESKKDSLRNAPSTEKRTLFFGGGTPSMLSSTHLSTLVKGIDNAIDISSLDEFSFEANPATFTRRKAAAWKALGITRVSLGAQSWEPGILSLLGRTHSPEDIEESVNILRGEGIPEINIDLMFSIPGQSLDQWKHTLDKAIQANPEHISAYNLTYEEDTPFFQQLQEGFAEIDEEKDAAFFETAHWMLKAASFAHYETSNYARDGKISHHNMAYWQGDDYIGIGPGAVGTLRGKRTENTSDTNLYIQTTLENGFPESSSEQLGPEDLRLERAALMLRTDRGISIDLLPSWAERIINSLIEEKMAEKKIVHGETRFILSHQGSLLVDEIVSSLFAAAD